MAAKKKNIDIKKNVNDLGNVLNETGQAIKSVFKDEKLIGETKKIGASIASAAKIFVERFKSKEVKKEFKDVKKAATKFGGNVAKTVKKATGKPVAKPAPKAKKPAAKKKTAKKKK